jgi:hypothetical protein
VLALKIDIYLIRIKNNKIIRDEKKRVKKEY